MSGGHRHNWLDCGFTLFRDWLVQSFHNYADKLVGELTRVLALITMSSLHVTTVFEGFSGVFIAGCVNSKYEMLGRFYGLLIVTTITSFLAIFGRCYDQPKILLSKFIILVSYHFGMFIAIGCMANYADWSCFVTAEHFLYFGFLNNQLGVTTKKPSPEYIAHEPRIKNCVDYKDHCYFQHLWHQIDIIYAGIIVSWSFFFCVTVWFLIQCCGVRWTKESESMTSDTDIITKNLGSWETSPTYHGAMSSSSAHEEAMHSSREHQKARCADFPSASNDNPDQPVQIEVEVHAEHGPMTPESSAADEVKAEVRAGSSADSAEAEDRTEDGAYSPAYHSEAEVPAEDGADSPAHKADLKTQTKDGTDSTEEKIATKASKYRSLSSEEISDSKSSPTPKYKKFLSEPSSRSRSVEESEIQMCPSCKKVVKLEEQDKPKRGAVKCPHCKQHFYPNIGSPE